MFEWLQLHFIPHERNNFRPHILHQRNIHRMIGVIMFVEVVAFLIPTIAFVGNADSQILPSVLSELTNQARATYHLPPLTVNATLNAAAQAKAEDMANNGYFAHVSPDGKTPWYWLDQVGYNYSYAGENLAVNFTDSKDVADAWMNSPTHRANILKADYTQVGTGVAEGMYQGSPTIFVAQDFASPANYVPLAKVITPIVVATNITTAAHADQRVLGAETKKATAKQGLPTANPAPAAIQGGSGPAFPNTVSSSGVPQTFGLTASAVPLSPIIQPTWWQRLQASPRQTTNIILFAIFGVVLLAVLLNIGIKISHHHPDLILNGVMVIALIACTFAMNNYITKSTITLTQSVDYTANHRIL